MLIAPTMTNRMRFLINNFLKTDAEMESLGRTWSSSDKASVSFR
jgi:hypothetical protein